MKKILVPFFLFFVAALNAQQTINGPYGPKTPDQVVKNFLVGAGVTPTSITFNKLPGLGLADQCGYFYMQSGGSAVGFGPGKSGALLTTGRSIVANGPNNTPSASDSNVVPLPTVGDPDLALLTSGNVKNVSILEFDFVATGLVLNFDYVFASEEYPEYVDSAFNDAFGFFLSGPGITGPYSNGAENLALIPNTKTGVSINTVNYHLNKDYYVSYPQGSPDTQYDGFTTVLRATHSLICGQKYHIKLAIANVGDNAWDSGVYIANFEIPPFILIDNYGLNENPSGYCYGDIVTLKSGVSDPGATFEWYKDNTLMTGAGTDTPNLTVTAAGTYTLKIYTSYGCLLGEDSIDVSFRAPLPINSPKNILLCKDKIKDPPPYTVNINQNSVILGSQSASDYDISYYDTSFADAQNGTKTGKIPNASLANYVVTASQTIWVRIEDLVVSGCVEVKPFDILVSNPSAGTIGYASTEFCVNNALDQPITTTLTQGGIYSANPAGLSINPGTGTITPLSSTPGTYTIDYKIPSDGVCPEYSAPSITIKIKSLPTVGVNSPTVCSGMAATVVATPSVPGTYNYSWTGPLAPPPGNVASFPTTVAGTYSVVIFDTVAGCSSSSSSGTVSLYAAPTITGPAFSVCQGQKIQLSGSGAPATLSTPWTSSNQAVATVDNAGWITGSSFGTSTITYTDSNGCSATAVVTVNGLPTATISGTATICSGTSTNITFNGTPNSIVTYTINSINGSATTTTTLNSSGISIVPTGNISSATTYDLVSIVNPTTTCGQSLAGKPNTQVSITTIAAPTINQPSDYIVCDDNYDGVACFVLSTKDAEISTVPGIQITYHRTVADAQNNVNGISKNLYCNNQQAFSQTLYVRVFDPSAPACASYTTLQLIVNPKPIINPNVADYQLCDNNNPGDGSEVFDLSTKDTAIINGQLSMTVSYYLNQFDAANETAGAALTNLYANTANPQTIWYAIKNTITGCSAVGSFKLVVNPLPIVTVNNPTVCEGDAATVTATPKVPGSYSYAWTVPVNASSKPGNVSAFTTLAAGAYSVVITNTVTGCVSLSGSGTVTHIAAPVINQPSDYIACDDNYDGVACFALNTKNAEISTVPGIQISYHRTPTDAHNNLNPLNQNLYCNNQNAFSQTLYVRVFDPSAPTCASYTALQLIVNPKPVINPKVGDYLLCDNNSPGDGSEVFDLSTKDASIINGQASMTVSYYLNQSDAANQTPGTALPNIYASTANPQTIWYAIKSTTTGCLAVGSFKLMVDPLPVINPSVADYQLCDYTTAGDGVEVFTLSTKNAEIINGQAGQASMVGSYYFSQADAMALSNPLPDSYPNSVANTQTIWYNIKNSTTGCSSVGSFNLVVNPLPLPLPLTQAYEVCDTYTDSLDGIGEFDLNTVTPQIVYANPGVYTVTYHKSQQEAADSSKPIDLSVPYHNTNKVQESLWVRAENPTTKCFSTLEIILKVIPAPQMPSLSPIVWCDTDSNTQDGCFVFDLTEKTQSILDAQSPSPASNFTVTYYDNPADASSSPAGPSIAAPTNYFACNATNHTVWVRIENNVAGCFNFGSFELQVNTPMVLTTPTLMSKCDDDGNPNDMYTVFDMATFVGTVPGHDLKFYEDAAHTIAIVDPSQYPNVQANQTVFIVATDTSTGCESYRTLTLEVLIVPTPVNPPALVACDDNSPGDMQEVFDLTANEGYIANGGTNLSFHYYPSEDEALAKQNEIIPANAALVGSNVWIRVENNYVDYQGNNCYVLVEQPVTVNPLPTVNQPVSFHVCDDDNDGFTVFDLTNSQLTTDLLGANQLPGDFTISYHATPQDAASDSSALPANYTNGVQTTETIYVRVVNNSTKCVNATGAVTLVVDQAAFATKPLPSSFNIFCDNLTPYSDGVGQVDLTLFDAEILNGQDPTVFLLSYYKNLQDAESGDPAIQIQDPTAYVTEKDSDHVFVRVENKDSQALPKCHAITTIDIIIERNPDVIWNNVHAICVDFVENKVVRPLTLDSGMTDPANYTFQWYEDGTLITGATESTYTVDTPAPGGATRNYTVDVTRTTTINGVNLVCETLSDSFDVLQSGQASIPAGTLGYTVTNAFTDNQVITVLIQGYGTYQYSLDDGPRQDSNVLQHVSSGTHTVTVWDNTAGGAYSCDELVIGNIQIIDYPHYFTPNGDGFHDTWNIVGLKDQPNVKIYIFDRFGKFLKQISTTGDGWDGTFNSQLLPADDYWFTVEYNEQSKVKVFKSHFTLKR